MPSSEPWGTSRAVRIERDDGIAWLWMNRPSKRNAMDREMDRQMYRALDELSVDDGIAVVVISGAGEAFCSGVDMKERFVEAQPDGVEGIDAVRYQAWKWERLAAFEKITIAMVNGWCVGGAFTQLLSCDLAIAADEAQFSLSEVNWGNIPGGMVTKLVADALLPRDALYYMLTADVFDGRRAAEIGLVNQSVPLATLRSATAQLARKILAKNQPAVRATKQAWRAVRWMDYGQAFEYLRAKGAQLRMVDHEQGQERGLREFLEDKSYKPALGTFDRRPPDAQESGNARPGADG